MIQCLAIISTGPVILYMLDIIPYDWEGLVDSSEIHQPQITTEMIRTYAPIHMLLHQRTPGHRPHNMKPYQPQDEPHPLTNRLFMRGDIKNSSSLIRYLIDYQMASIHYSYQHSSMDES